MISNVAWERFNDIQLDIEELEKRKKARRYEIQKNCYSAIARASKIAGNKESASHQVITRVYRISSDGDKLTRNESIHIRYRDRNMDIFLRLHFIDDRAEWGCNIHSEITIFTVNMKNDGSYRCKSYRRIISGHCNALHGIPRSRKNTPKTLRDLVDVINQQLRALPYLGEDVSSWNSLLMFVIL